MIFTSSKTGMSSVASVKCTHIPPQEAVAAPTPAPPTAPAVAARKKDESSSSEESDSEDEAAAKPAAGAHSYRTHPTHSGVRCS